MTIPLKQIKPFLVWLQAQGHDIMTIDNATLERYYNEYLTLKITTQE